jgi:hypothetical protein
MDHHVEYALRAGQKAGAKNLNSTWDEAVYIAYENACNLYDGDDSVEFTDNEFDLISGAYIGGFLGARYRTTIAAESKTTK